jgi:hypothetical protein
MKVVVRQWPCGTAATRRSPDGLRPYRRAILVAVPVSSTKTNRAGSMKRCQTRHSRRLPATPGRSCSAALTDFFMPDADPAERVVDRREPGDEAKAALKRRLGERDVRGRLNQPAQLALVRREQRAPMPAVPRRRGAAGRAHPLHQLDRCRGADGKAPRGGADRTAALDCAHDSLPEIHGHGSRHGDISVASTAIERITGVDPTQ